MDPGSRRPGRPPLREVSDRANEIQCARFQPGLPEDAPDDELATEHWSRAPRSSSSKRMRRAIAPLTRRRSARCRRLHRVVRAAKDTGPGQGDPLFPWLARHRQRRTDEMVSFAGSRGRGGIRGPARDDPGQDAGSGQARDGAQFLGRDGTRPAKGMHGPMLERLAGYFELSSDARYGRARGARAWQHHDRPRAPPPLCVSFGRCARRHRDDGADACGLRDEDCAASACRRGSGITSRSMRCST